MSKTRLWLSSFCVVTWLAATTLSPDLWTRCIFAIVTITQIVPCVLNFMVWGQEHGR